MGHQIISEGGADLAPAAGFTLGAEGGADLAPAVHGVVTAEGGASLSPAVHGVITAEGGLGQGVLVAGALTPDATGYFPLVGAVASGRPVYAPAPGDVPPNQRWTYIFWNGVQWELIHYPTGSTGPQVSWRANVGVEATPDLAAGWFAVDGDPEGTGTPTFALASGSPEITPTAEGGASLGPAAPAQITPESSY